MPTGTRREPGTTAGGKDRKGKDYLHVRDAEPRAGYTEGPPACLPLLSRGVHGERDVSRSTESAVRPGEPVVTVLSPKEDYASRSLLASTAGLIVLVGAG